MKVINNLKHLFDVKNVISIHNFILLFIIFLIFCSIFNNKIIEGIDDDCSLAKQQLEDNKKQQINDLKTQIENLNKQNKLNNDSIKANTTTIRDLDKKYTEAIRLLKQSQKQGKNTQEKAMAETNKSKNIKDTYK